MVCIMYQKSSLSRFFKLVLTPYSMLRFMQYEIVSLINLKGKVLDIGGVKNATYHDLLVERSNITCLNIDKEKADITADANFPLPINDNSFDDILSLNTFEHIRHDELALRETIRVLRPGGSFHFFVPFLYKEHGSPFDYHRHTKEWWVEIMNNLDVENLQVVPLVWDRFASGCSFFDSTKYRIPKILIRFIFCLPGLVRFYLGIKRVYEDYAVGFYITGNKKISDWRTNS